MRSSTRATSTRRGVWDLMDQALDLTGSSSKVGCRRLPVDSQALTTLLAMAGVRTV